MSEENETGEGLNGTEAPPWLASQDVVSDADSTQKVEVPAVKPKRKRRTKAEMEAAKEAAQVVPSLQSLEIVPPEAYEDTEPDTVVSTKPHTDPWIELVFARTWLIIGLWFDRVDRCLFIHPLPFVCIKLRY